MAQPDVEGTSGVSPEIMIGKDNRQMMPSAQSVGYSMKAHVEAIRCDALRIIQEASATSYAEISQLGAEVDQSCCRHAQDFLQYCEIGKPMDYKQQRSRNNVREELQNVGQHILTCMQRVFSASTESAEVLHAQEKALLSDIDDTIRMLSALRTETVASFAECSDKLDADRQSAEAMMISLIPSIEAADRFMQCLSREVQHEQLEADCINEELLQKLCKEEATYVEANDSPSWNPGFAKVQDELVCLKQRREDQASSHAAHLSCVQTWNAMIQQLSSRQSLTSKQNVTCEPPRRSFWTCVSSYFAHSAVSSA
jgi:hypothetical protein